ncbi:phasin family protein [Bifidobacterium canis]|uniref:Cytosolic protein n=1 Tax=Bifidobacterium canis TaxID=2610880 RepID=A0A7K1J486_9BIFI|nr:phasin family protein [Bifidobacterium canis]MUH59457.1 cytosolic protein [Bifidobacterium canis]
MSDDNKNVFPDFGEGLRKIFLAGVGAIATTADKGQEIINDLVQRGELTVEQGKKLNSELAHKANDQKTSLKDKANEATNTVRDAAAGLRNQAEQNLKEDTASEDTSSEDAAEQSDSEK